MTKPLPCLCGVVPEVHPLDPEIGGNAWGSVFCKNPDCPAQPIVNDGLNFSDDRGSDAYKEAAILRWNKWISGKLNWRRMTNKETQ